jgi:hypothetical protein
LQAAKALLVGEPNFAQCGKPVGGEAFAAGQDEGCIYSRPARAGLGLVMAKATCHCKLRENMWRFTFKAKIVTDQNVYTIAYRSLDRLKRMSSLTQKSPLDRALVIAPGLRH